MKCKAGLAVFLGGKRVRLDYHSSDVGREFSLSVGGETARTGSLREVEMLRDSLDMLLLLQGEGGGVSPLVTGERGENVG